MESVDDKNNSTASEQRNEPLLQSGIKTIQKSIEVDQNKRSIWFGDVMFMFFSCFSFLSWVCDNFWKMNVVISQWCEAVNPIRWSSTIQIQWNDKMFDSRLIFQSKIVRRMKSVWLTSRCTATVCHLRCCGYRHRHFNYTSDCRCYMTNKITEEEVKRIREKNGTMASCHE